RKGGGTSPFRRPDAPDSNLARAMLRPASTWVDATPMSQVETRSFANSRTAERVKPPSVLVVLVVKDGAQWLPHCLLGLSRQTHRRVGVLAADNGPIDDSHAILQTALGESRVIGLERNQGFGAAVVRALGTDMAAQADYV